MNLLAPRRVLVAERVGEPSDEDLMLGALRSERTAVTLLIERYHEPLFAYLISDVEAVADRLVLLSHGRLIADACPDELITSARGKVWLVVTSQQEALRLQSAYPTSALVAQSGGTAVRVLSRGARVIRLSRLNRRSKTPICWRRPAWRALPRVERPKVQAA